MKEKNLPLYTRRDKAGNARQFSIVDFAIYKGMLPTPRTRDWKGCEGRRGDIPSYIEDNMGYQTGKTSKLSPQFVLEMMGFPTDWTLLPFLNGEMSPSKQVETQ